MMKLMIFGRRRGGMTVAQLHRYMEAVHGAMVVRFIAEAPDETPRRYVQNHVFDATFRVPGATPDPFSVARDFVTQVWFDHPAQAAASLQAPLYREHLQPDEDRFVDQPSVARLAVAERMLFGGAAAGAKTKLFLLWQRAPGVPADTLAAATEAAWQPLLQQAAGHGLARLVRNTALARPGETPAADLADEAWLAGEDAARALAETWQALAEAPALRELQAPGSLVVLLAREKVMFAGAEAVA